MNKNICTNSAKRQTWAVSLCLAATTILSLEALHPQTSVYFNMGADQYFALAAILASLCCFFGVFVLSDMITQGTLSEKND